MGTTKAAADPRLGLWRSLMEAHAVVTGNIERELDREQGLPLTWCEVLFRLAQAPQGALRMQDLAGRLVLSRSGVTRLADRMEAAGLIERASCSSDRRGTFAVVTEAGRQALERARPALRRAVQERFASHFSDAEALAFERALRRVLEANGHVDQGTLP